MIISASRRTDIPAFYTDWFMNRVREGFFYRVNPFNSRQVTGFSLKPEHVDAICFWTKNPRPLMPHLEELDRRGLNYFFQFTLNPYDATFEPLVPPLVERLAAFRELAGLIGPERVIWRYDPVILTGVTPIEWHLEHADLIARQLQDATQRLMFSFYDFYGSGEGRLDKVLRKNGIELHDITAPGHKDALEQIAKGFKDITERYDMGLYSCCEETDLAEFGIPHGACIDSDLLSRLFGIGAVAKDRNQRAGCNCAESVDMGSYNSCPFRCSYCYANFNERMIEKNRRNHDPNSPALVGRYEGTVDVQTGLKLRRSTSQQPLF
jgi:DNA repair photolyase